MSDADQDLFDRVVGARLSMRNAAQQILDALDQMAVEGWNETGWRLEEITLLERLAKMRVGVWIRMGEP